MGWGTYLVSGGDSMRPEWVGQAEIQRSGYIRIQEGTVKGGGLVCAKIGVKTDERFYTLKIPVDILHSKYTSADLE